MDEWTFDLVVVGSGTGLLGALTAADAGRSVLVVEKSDVVGGSTALSGGGFWLPTNAVLRAAGAVDSPERVRTYLRHVTAGEVPDERWEPVVGYGPAAVEVLRRRTPLRLQWMVGYPDYAPELPGGSATGRAVEPRPFDLRRLGPDRARVRASTLALPLPMPITSQSYRWLSLVARRPRGAVLAARALGLGLGGLALGREYVAGGRALVAGLLAGVRAAGVPVWLDAPLRDLVVEDGRVVGVVVRREGRDVTVRATRGVLLSAGGFDHNAAMRHDHLSPYLDPGWSLGSPSNTGDAIQIAAAVGADLAFMDEAWWFPAIPLPGGQLGMLLAERALPGQMIVNGRGRRFMDEAVNYMTAGHVILAKHRPDDPHIPAWIVFDQRYRDRYLFGTAVFPRQPLPAAWYDAGIAHRADTIGDLAARVGLPDLAASVARFNLLAGAGRDDDFHRGDSAYDRYYGDPRVTPNPCLGPIEVGPFYAVQVVPGDLGTCGGIRTDASGRALRPDGTVLEGLYASGNAAANPFGRAYPGPGATIGAGLAYAYVAARHATGRLEPAARSSVQRTPV